jgi:hypothetical protein
MKGSSDASALRQAWDAFHSASDEARVLIEKTERFRSRPEYRGRAYASLMEAQAWAYNFAIAPRLNVQHPQIYWHSTWHANVFGLGQPFQDCRYGGLFLDGQRTYRLSGTLGAVKLLLMQVHSRLLGDPHSEEIGNYDFHAFQLGDGGSFEVVISATEHDGNWIRLDPDSDYNFILIRRIVGDWHDDLGTLSLTDVSPSMDCTAGPQWDEDMQAAISSGTRFLTYLVRDYIVGLYDLYIERAGGRKNSWATMPGKDFSTWLIGSPSVTYVPGIYDLSHDEAVIVEWDPPASAYWSIQLGDVWSRPLHYMDHQTDINMERAVLDSDGKFRAVISIEDPGVANWLDPTGNTEGTVVVRSYRSRGETVAPKMLKVAASDLKAHLPADTALVSLQERQAALDYRRSATFEFFHR